MFSGYYTIASGILTRQHEINVAGNNLTNSQTPGYRAERMVTSSFEQELLTRKDARRQNTIGPAAATAAAVADVQLELQQGTLVESDRSCDMAIAGDGFFSVADAAGNEYLTRGGSFDLDAQGYLVLPGFGRVMGQNGYLRPGTSNFTVEPTGEMIGADGRRIGTIRVSVPSGNAVLKKAENGLLRLESGGLERSPASTLLQKKLEQSNVDLNRELAALIETQRAFQICGAALQIDDAMTRKATQIAAV